MQELSLFCATIRQVSLFVANEAKGTQSIHTSKIPIFLYSTTWTEPYAAMRVFQPSTTTVTPDRPYEHGRPPRCSVPPSSLYVAQTFSHTCIACFADDYKPLREGSLDSFDPFYCLGSASLVFPISRFPTSSVFPDMLFA